MSQNPALAYRPDIDGLRAIAVLSVVFYHFGIGGLSGGFVGVDVFYVISGFLITGIIQREIEQGRFTFAGFYERRIRRIFPALFVVLAATLAVGTAILLPTDLILLGKSTLATLLFSSNILFWRTSGYFDGNSELNPLLHTWSLAVEEQFYIGLPILLLLVYRYARGWLKPVLVVSTILSFAACLWVQELRPTAAFYLSPFRAWELLLGSYLAVGNLPQVAKSWQREALAWLGLFMLVLSIVFIKSGPDFPGWQALGPVIGTSLLIYAGGSGRTKISSWISVKPVVFIGHISYSLYLWHWPVVVFLKYGNALEPLDGLAWAGLLISFILAFLSYRFIETPFREKKIVLSRRRLFALTAIVSTCLVFSGSTVWLLRGLPKRFSAEVLQLDAERSPKIPYKECDGKAIEQNVLNSKCKIGSEIDSVRVVVWGDSHALAMAPAFDSIYRQRQQGVALLFDSACPPLLGVNNPISPDCLNNNRRVTEYIENQKSINTVILVASWTSYVDELGQYRLVDENGFEGNAYVFPPAIRRTIDYLNKLGVKLFIVGPVPGAPSDAPLRMAIRRSFSEPIPDGKTLLAFKKQSFGFYAIGNNLDRQRIINPFEWFCSQQSCRYVEGGLPLYRDGGHLNVRGAKYIEPALASELAEIAQ